MKTPEISDEAMSNHLLNIVERMAKAKWATGCGLVTPNSVNVHLTALGRRQIGKLAKYARPFEDLLYGGKVSALAHFKVWVAMLIHAHALLHPSPSRERLYALVLVVAQEARKLRLGEA